MIRKYIIFSAIGIASVPFWLWGAWMATPRKKMVVAIVDKTEHQRKGRQHMSLTWILNNEKYTKTHEKLYDLSDDYFGFHAKQNSEYKIKGLERFSSANLDQLSDDCDVAYYADAYGVYNKDLTPQSNNLSKAGIVYGGLTQQDVDFLKKVKSRKKLVISEYNILQSPTPARIRSQFENIFGLKWSGWTCRYFDSLDPSENKDLPGWLVNSYKVRNGGIWPFTKAGLAFVNNLGQAVILEDYRHLNNPLPYVRRSTAADPSLAIPDNVKFPFWFDIMIPDATINTVAASFDIDLTEEGRNELIRHAIPLNMPAIITHQGNDYQFYYFSGSFCSLNTLSMSSSYFKWISAFKSFLFNEDDTLESTSFFWNFYRPLITSILDNYYSKISKRGK